MKFGFVLGNHGEGRDSLYDICDAIWGQLVDLGHEVVRHDEGFVREHINIIIEAFDERLVARMKEAKENGSRFIVVMTERPGKPGWNDSKRIDMIVRQRCFPLAAPHAEAVWCLVPGTAKWARRFNPNAVELELGYSRTRETWLAASDSPVMDFCFYGSMSPRRKRILEQIEKRGYKVGLLPGVLPHVRDRDNMISLSCLALGIDPHSGWKLVSNSRIATALHCRRAIIAEPPYDRSSPWAKVGVFAKSHGSFIDEAIAALDDWRGLRDHQLERFREFFSPEQCVGKALVECGFA